jgi:hypothetical protein
MFCALGEQRGAKNSMSCEASAAALKLGAWQVAGGQGQAVAQQSSEVSQQDEVQSAAPAVLIAAMENGVKAKTKVMAMSVSSFIGAT